MRDPQSLAGTWQFQVDPDGSLTPATLAPDREITVPLPWQAAFPELQTYNGYAWYRRQVDVPAAWLDGELLLHFGAVDYWCQVFVNGVLVGEHEGGYTAFTLPIRAHVQAGANEIALRVYDATQTHILIPRWPDYQPEQGPSAPPFDANNIPHGKQEWYINVGGIWQDVTLTAVPAYYVDHIAVVPDIHAGTAQVTVTLAGAWAEATGTLALTVLGAGEECGRADVPLVAEQDTYTATLAIRQPRLWQLDDPYLYTMRVGLDAGGDRLETRFGLREIATGNGQLLLNGEPLFLLAALDQDLYPDTIYTVPSEAYLRDQFQKAKELGLNCLRCHIKPPDPRYLDLADEMGLLVWAEIPSWRTFFPKGNQFPALLDLEATIKTRVEATLRAMIRRDFNHPSLIIWTLVNEDWGTALPLSAPDRAWLGAFYQQCKALDPTRLVVDNSACPHPWGPNVHVHSDIDDFHFYANIPDHGRGFEQSVEQLGLRPLWTYSNAGDTVRSGQEPLILSEFGNWGLPSISRLRAHHGGEPPWFAVGPWWSPWEGEAGWAEGIERRFTELGLDTIWPDLEAFTTATQWHQYAAMKFEIEAIRRQPALAGYVITEFTDAYWESNGLLDFVRGTKAYHHEFARINSPDVVLPQPTRYNYWDDEQVPVTVHAAHYSAAEWHGVRLAWAVGGEAAGSTALPDMDRATVARLPGLEIALPPVEQAQTVPVDYVLADATGQPLARNRSDLLVLPQAARVPGYAGRVAVLGREQMSADDAAGGPMVAEESSSMGGRPTNINLSMEEADDPPTRSELERLVRRAGYRTVGRLTADTGLVISNYPNAALLRWVRAGGDLLFLCNGPSPFFWAGGRGGAYSGGWITNWSWLRPGIHRRLAGVANPLSLPFAAVMPHHTILGLPVDNPAVQGDFLAGLVAGWVHHPAIHTVQFRYGTGRVLMTTFALDGCLGSDPVATAMFHDLVDHLHSAECAPTLQANY